jgi:hypothetical protein
MVRRPRTNGRWSEKRCLINLSYFYLLGQGSEISADGCWVDGSDFKVSHRLEAEKYISNLQ